MLLAVVDQGISGRNLDIITHNKVWRLKYDGCYLCKTAGLEEV